MKRILGLSLTLSLLILTSCDSMKSMSNSFNPMALLTGNSWALESLLGKSAADLGGAIPFLQFNEDGSMNGSTGCNNFNGSFNLEGANLNLLPGAMTKRACPNSGEKDFLNALQQVSSVSGGDGNMSLLDAAGNTVMSFIPKM